MDFVHSAGLFCFQLDVGGNRVLLVQLSEQEYREASFLDNRLLQQQRPMQWVDWTQITQVEKQLPHNAQFIFHIGHVGSTLISRLLGEAGDTLSLREPQILRQFAELKPLDGKPHSEWRPGEFGKRLDGAIHWLSRTFAPGQRSLVKATSFVSEIAGDILSNGRKSIFLTLKPERYIQTILAGENSRQELSALSSARLMRLNQRLEAKPINLWELDEAKRAAMAWATEMTALEAASGDNVMWVDFDAFLANPAAQLHAMAQFLTIDLSAEQAARLAAGPMMQQYSKAPEHGYSKQLREQVMAQAAAERRAEIAAALEWLETLAAANSAVAKAMGRV